MKNLIVTTIAVAAFAFVAADSAEAQSRYRSFGPAYGGSNFGGAYGNSGYNRGFRGYGVRGRSWGGGHYHPHTTTHFDYHGPSLQPHGNHFDFVPGHYHPHTTTHFDYHRGH